MEANHRSLHYVRSVLHEVAGATCGLSGGIEALGHRVNAASGFGRKRRAVPKRGLRSLPKVIPEVMDTIISSTTRPYPWGMALPRISNSRISPKLRRTTWSSVPMAGTILCCFTRPSDATAGCINSQLKPPLFLASA